GLSAARAMPASPAPPRLMTNRRGEWNFDRPPHEIALDRFIRSRQRPALRIAVHLCDARDGGHLLARTVMSRVVSGAPRPDRPDYGLGDGRVDAHRGLGRSKRVPTGASDAEWRLGCCAIIE